MDTQTVEPAEMRGAGVVAVKEEEIAVNRKLATGLPKHGRKLNKSERTDPERSEDMQKVIFVVYGSDTKIKAA